MSDRDQPELTREDFIEAQVQATLRRFKGLVTPQMEAEVRWNLAYAMRTDPRLKALVERLLPRAQKEHSEAAAKAQAPGNAALDANSPAVVNGAPGDDRDKGKGGGA
jgi:hypothetical protein